MKKQIALILLLAICASIFTGCFSTEVESLSINDFNVSIFIGEAYQINCDVSPADAKDNLTWTSDSTSIATVDENGKVTGREIGECNISVISENYMSDRITVYVMEDFSGRYQFLYGMVDGEYVDSTSSPDMYIEVRRDKTVDIYDGTELVHSFTFDCTDSTGNYFFHVIDEDGASLSYDRNEGTVTYASAEFTFVFD